jgi:hypothetical protein
MSNDRAIFPDGKGRGWLVEVLHGHPSPTELGIHAVRFTCPEDPDEPVRVGYLYREAIERNDEAALREALAESEPARAVG